MVYCAFKIFIFTAYYEVRNVMQLREILSKLIIEFLTEELITNSQANDLMNLNSKLCGLLEKE